MISQPDEYFRGKDGGLHQQLWNESRSYRCWWRWYSIVDIFWWTPKYKFQSWFCRILKGQDE